jgi:SAM-dependent methyltransferase
MLLRHRFRKVLLLSLITSVLAIVCLSVIATLLFFPWSTDPRNDETAGTRRFYEKVYLPPQLKDARAPVDSAVAPLSEKDQFYIDFGRKAALNLKIPQKVEHFVARFDLTNKKVLEAGAGTGLLQDIVADYTGLDISPSARRFFHKPFVEASATEMPFPDNTFDGLWSIWVLEHIPNPEKALMEMRRVVKPGGYIFLYPAFNVSRYAARGYITRPYKDFDLMGKLIKATAPLVYSRPWHFLQHHQIQIIRYLAAHWLPGPTRLHYVRLTPNYDQFWEADSDAAIALSHYELYLWFTTRGDLCIDAPSEARMVLQDVEFDFSIKVSKPHSR